MKIAYLDCFAGASGDMLLGAFVDAGFPQSLFRQHLQELPLQNFSLDIRKIKKNGFSATKVDVIVHEDAPERHGHEIAELIARSNLPDMVREGAQAVFRRMCEVEAEIHQSTPENVHLHELSGLDTIIDVVGTLLAVHFLGIEKIYVSPLPLGRGFVSGAHGRIPLPAPATISLLKDVPVYGVELEAELVTPTGAALLTHLAERFGPFPPMTVQSLGYGAGSRDLPIPNLLRLVIGEAGPSETMPTESLYQLEANVDDQNPEQLAFVLDKLLQHGALDAFFTPITMKKSRPAVLISVLCPPEKVAQLEQILFAETTTLGVRRQRVERSCLPRRNETVSTPFGESRVKIALLPDGTTKLAPEYEDCRILAEKTGRPLREVYAAVLRAAEEKWSKKGDNADV